MSSPKRASIMQMMAEILARQGRAASIQEPSSLREIGFRSLDFAELALRVEASSGITLDFEGAALRSVQTVADVLDFLEKATGGRA